MTCIQVRCGYRMTKGIIEPLDIFFVQSYIQSTVDVVRKPCIAQGVLSPGTKDVTTQGAEIFL